MRSLTIAFIGLRLAWCVAVLQYCSAWSYLLVASELAAIGLAAWNCAVAKTWTTSPLSLAVYASSYAIAPTAAAPPVLVLVAALRLATLCYMQASYSAGAHNFVRLVDRGPFAIVRHPLALLFLVGRITAALWWFTPWNVGCAAVGTLLTIALIYDEESFLSQFDEWRAYADRVRWRLIPGGW